MDLSLNEANMISKEVFLNHLTQVVKLYIRYARPLLRGCFAIRALQSAPLLLLFDPLGKGVRNKEKAQLFSCCSPPQRRKKRATPPFANQIIASSLFYLFRL